MEYLTVRETAEKWSLSDRMVQQFCIDGRIPGAQKFGKSWAIPMEAEKPQDPRVSRRQKQQAAGPLDITCLMPLMNTPFQPGKCLAVVETMAAGPQRDISLAEYHYFSGHPEEAAKGAEPYLTSTDMGARLSACLIYAYANLPLGHIQRARFALNELKAALGSQRGSPEMEAASAFVARGCRRSKVSSHFCRWACGLLPCISMPTTVTSRGTMPPASVPWRGCWPWGPDNIRSLPSTSTWWR